MKSTKAMIKVAAMLAASIALMALAGCGDDEKKQAEEMEKAKAEALQQFMKQGNGKVRKPGESGFSGFSSSDMKPGHVGQGQAGSSN